MAINGNLHMSLTKPPLCRQALKHLKTTYLPRMPKNEPLSDGIYVAFTFHWFYLVIGEAVRLEGPTVLSLWGAIIVQFFALAGFTFVKCPVQGNDDGDDDGNGGDNDDWPVDGTKGVFVLNCAKAILIQLTIDAMQIAISPETKMMPIISDYIVHIKNSANISCLTVGK